MCQVYREALETPLQGRIKNRMDTWQQEVTSQGYARTLWLHQGRSSTLGTLDEKQSLHRKIDRPQADCWEEVQAVCAEQSVFKPGGWTVQGIWYRIFLLKSSTRTYISREWLLSKGRLITPTTQRETRSFFFLFFLFKKTLLATNAVKVWTSVQLESCHFHGAN